MRVIWISNIAFGPLCELADQGKPTSGSWLDAAYNTLVDVEGLELICVTVSRVKEIQTKKVRNHHFCLLPGGYPSEYNPNSMENRKNWETIREQFKPDVIQVWGTEFSHGYLALQVMKGIPSVIYMQGLMSQIANHYLSGISNTDLNRSITLRDILKFDWIKRQQTDFKRRSLIEGEMIKISQNVIVENNWCELHCKSMTENCKVYKSNLPTKDEFFQEDWSVEKMQPYTIMSNAAGYPIKGLHILLKALSLVVKRYPNAKLIIPGQKSFYERTYIEKLKTDGYTKYLLSIIKKYRLKDNIQFLGRVDSSWMAANMAKANVFVMPSSIENHSSTLIEAMLVGTPCIASYVGGVPEYLTHGVNGVMYRFEEHEILASHIMKIFEDRTFAQNIGLNGKNMMRTSRKSNNIKEDFLSVYDDLLKSTKY